MKIKELTKKEKLFCAYYCVCRSPREAAARAGYAFAERTGLRLLRRQDIADETARIDSKRRSTEKDIAMGYSRLAFGCVSDAVALMFSDEITAEEIEKLDLFAVSEIKRKKGGDIEIKFFDRLKALDKLRELSQGQTPAALNLYSAIEQGAKALREDKHG